MQPGKPHEQAVCARCGAAIDVADFFEIRAKDGAGSAFLCRTEHIVAWVMRGAEWQLERPWEVAEVDRRASGPLTLVRGRSGEATERTFEDTEALRKWAVAGGFWSEP